MSQAQEIENIQEKLNWHWRNTMRPVRFFNFDARAALPLPLLLFNLTSLPIWSLFFLTLFTFRFLEQKGLTFPAALRNLRAWLVGDERPGLPTIYKKKFRDFG